MAVGANLADHEAAVRRQHAGVRDHFCRDQAHPWVLSRSPRRPNSAVCPANKAVSRCHCSANNPAARRHCPTNNPASRCHCPATTSRCPANNPGSDSSCHCPKGKLLCSLSKSQDRASMPSTYCCSWSSITRVSSALAANNLIYNYQDPHSPIIASLRRSAARRSRR